MDRRREGAMRTTCSIPEQGLLARVQRIRRLRSETSSSFDSLLFPNVTVDFQVDFDIGGLLLV